jgi:predicted PurR-regulated permease PerM
MIVLGVYLLFKLVEAVHPLLLTAFLGLLFGLGVAKGADYLLRFRVPRAVGSLLIVLAVYGLLYGAGVLAAPVLSRQFGQLRNHLPEALDRVESWLVEHRGGLLEEALQEGSSGATGPSGPTAPAAATAPSGPSGASAPARHHATPPPAAAKPAPAPAPPSASPLRRTLARQLGAASTFLFPFLSSTVEVLVGIILITFIALYVAIDPGLYRRGLLHLVPHAARRRAEEVVDAMVGTLRRWLLAQFVAMIVIGVAVGVALGLLGVEAALSLGVIAGLLEFIPTVGPILAAMPAIAMGFLVSPQKALAVLLVFTLLQQLEGNLLIPMLMKRGMELPPLVTLLGQALMAAIFGFLGLVIAVPLVATIVVAVKLLYVEDIVGDPMSQGSETG